MSLQDWENYYRGGALATCPMGPGSGYTKELHDTWVKFFSGLPEGARILDIGTGNGAIALIALETANAAGRHYEIHGSDLAQIDPVRDVQDGARLFTGIRFHARVATERLPFEACSFDAVSGQYALEYTLVERSLQEIHRVLKAGGRAQFILHHANSIVVTKARESLRQTALVLEHTMVYRKLRRHLEAERQSKSGARRTQADLIAAVDALHQAAGQTDNPLTISVTIDAVQKLLAVRQQLSPVALDREIDRAESDIRASMHRLQDLVRSGQSESGMKSISEFALTRGFEVREMAHQYHAGDNLVGWRMCLTRP